MTETKGTFYNVSKSVWFGHRFLSLFILFKVFTEDVKACDIDKFVFLIKKRRVGKELAQPVFDFIYYFNHTQLQGEITSEGPIEG